MTRRRDTMTADLFSWEPPKVAAGYGQDVAGRGSLDNRIARTIGRALKDAKEQRGLQRADVARRMTEFLGRTISEDTINKWSSEASGQHRISLDAFIALIEATGALDLMGLVTTGFGFVAVPEKYGDLIELHLVEEHEQKIAARRQALEAKVRGLR